MGERETGRRRVWEQEPAILTGELSVVRFALSLTGARPLGSFFTATAKRLELLACN